MTQIEQALKQANVDLWVKAQEYARNKKKLDWLYDHFNVANSITIEKIEAKIRTL